MINKQIYNYETVQEYNKIFPIIEQNRYEWLEDISNHTKEKDRIIYETVQEYNKIFPIIEQNRYEWLEDIFNHTKEKDRIIHETSEYVLIPDIVEFPSIDYGSELEKQLSNIHCLIFYKDKRLKSIRNLNSSNITNILKSVYESIPKIKKKYNLPDSVLYRMEFHYHPSVWQLHLHIYIEYVNGKYIFNNNFSREKRYTYQLKDIIKNLEQNDKYYSEGTLVIGIAKKINYFKFVKNILLFILVLFLFRINLYNPDH
jgi:hypothetical protein